MSPSAVANAASSPGPVLALGDTVLITGASGFIGSRVLRALEARGVRRRVLVRPSSPRGNLDAVDCDIRIGDMTDRAAMAAALDGARFLFHVAADYRLWAADPAELFRANVDGARAVMEAALEARVERIVYTSSVATLRAGDAATVADETAALGDGEGIGAYKRSKVAAERLVERMVAERGLPAVIVSPSTPIGPGDIRPTPTGRMIVEAATGKIPAFVDTGLNLVHVDDVALGHLLALERGRIGERYILGGQDASLRDFLAEIAALTGRKPPTLNLPRAPLYPIAVIAEMIAQVTGKEPMITRDALKMAAHHMFFTSAKAERELGYAARPYREALVDALASFRADGPAAVTALVIASVSLAAWVYLLVGRGFFWLMRERDDAGVQPPEPARWPSVAAIVPARDEADVIARSLGSLLAQDYPGDFRIVLVDDGSTDDTRRVALLTLGPRNLEVLTGQHLPSGWTGKLWAVRQGIAWVNGDPDNLMGFSGSTRRRPLSPRRVGAGDANATDDAPGNPDYLLLTDADIAHSPDNLRRLVARAEAGRLVMVSLMAQLCVTTWAERLLIPAFVFFFDMLYPFAWANDPRRRLAAAAGGCVLVRRDALEAAGGVEAIRGEIIDDCALARRLKAVGPTWLGLTHRARSLRPYASLGEIGRMVSRSAYAQLGYSPLVLAGTVAGMAIIYLAGPVLTLVGEGPAQWLGAAAWLAMAVSFQPLLRFYGRSPLWGLALPVIGALYTAFTLASALAFLRGRGGLWKGRAQAMAQ